MLKYFTIVAVGISMISGQTWVSRASLRNHVSYWETLMQEMVHEMENRQWCTMKLDDITQTIDDNLFNMRVNGTVHYTNGFVVSIQKIDITNIEQLVTSRDIDNVTVPFGTVRGRLNFRDLMVGYDVFANLLIPEGEYRATGTFLHTLVQIQLDVTQDLNTKEFSSSPSVLSASFGSGVRMQYMPSSSVTEALSRRFWHSTFDSARNWAVDTIVPIMLDIATSKLDFPEICFNNCS